MEVYVGDIPYWNYTNQVLEIGQILRTDIYVRNDSVEFWFQNFYNDCCVEYEKDFCKDLMNESSTCQDELGFKRRILRYLGKYPHFGGDIHFNISSDELNQESYIKGNFEIKGIRAKYQYSQLDNIDIKTKAMDTMKSKLRNITFDTNSENNLNHPIAYTFMFIQWEANRVISHELVRNLSLTFGTIAIGDFNFIL